MSFRQKLKYYLVHNQQISTKEAAALIAKGMVEINGATAEGSEVLKAEDTVSLQGKVIKSPTIYRYYRFYKPTGVESTLHPEVKDGIKTFIDMEPGLAIAGRLDKASEGLLLISDDGKWIEDICNPKAQKSKTYEVQLSPAPDSAFVEAFSKGVVLGGGYLTKPCQCKIVSENCVEVVLTEGKNRQIRRMCHKLGFSVLGLKRTAIDEWQLSELQPFQYTHFQVNKDN